MLCAVMDLCADIGNWIILFGKVERNKMKVNEVLALWIGLNVISHVSIEYSRYCWNRWEKNCGTLGNTFMVIIWMFASSLRSLSFHFAIRILRSVCFESRFFSWWHFLILKFAIGSFKFNTSNLKFDIYEILESS